MLDAASRAQAGNSLFRNFGDNGTFSFHGQTTSLVLRALSKLKDAG